MLAKLSKLGENMKELSSNVSKLTNHVLKKVDNTDLIEVMKDASSKSVNAIKELTDTMKTLNTEDRTLSHIPSQALQEESTQILLEKESQKIKQSIIDKWNTNLTKRRTEYWQMLRNKNTSETYDTWKKSVPMVIPCKFQMKAIEGEPLTQTQRREKQVIYNFQTDIELLELRAGSHEDKCRAIDKNMEELICQKATGQRREMVLQLWKSDCEREERTSTERWENTSLKWFKNYEEDFLNSFSQKTRWYGMKNVGHHVRITYPCDLYPLTPHLYIVKLGCTGVYIFFLFFALKHRLWVLIRTASMRRF